MTEETIFDKILSGEIPAHKVYEDEHTFAFLDIAPINKGHTLVIPKNATRNILTVDKETLGHVMETVRFLSPKIKEAVAADGITIGMNNEAAGGQEVFHLHAHIIPRFEGDGHKHWSGDSYKDKEAVETLEKIVSKVKK